MPFLAIRINYKLSTKDQSYTSRIYLMGGDHDMNKSKLLASFGKLTVPNILFSNISPLRHISEVQLDESLYYLIDHTPQVSINMIKKLKNSCDKKRLLGMITCLVIKFQFSKITVVENTIQSVYQRLEKFGYLIKIIIVDFQQSQISERDKEKIKSKLKCLNEDLDICLFIEDNILQENGMTTMLGFIQNAKSDLNFKFETALINME